MADVSRAVLAKIIASMLDEGVRANRVSKQVAAYLVQERRTRELDALMRDVQNLRAQNGILEANTTSAYTLSSTVKHDITALLRRHHTGTKTVVLDEVVDKRVVGGVRVETATSELDLTIRSKLNKLKTANA